ncbi:MAG TPA: hypothetical protein VNX22_07150 [Acidobacteriaceae bacterium]|nr:hypothetical protein [Acidobacteriaceae bacterium]
MKNRVIAQRFGVWSRVLLCASAAFFYAGVLSAEPVAVRYPQGSLHGFLTLRTMQGELIAAGDLVQEVRGDRVTLQLVFHFKDGSIDDEIAVFSQRDRFQLISDRHVQKGPSFPHPVDLSIEVSTGQVTTRYVDGGKEQVTTEHLELAPDLANGVIFTLMTNLRPDAPGTRLPFVVSTPKPRIVKLAISPQGEDTFSVAGSRRKATRYVVKVEIGGLAGVVAPVLGKQPPDTHVWIFRGEVPAFVKSEGPRFEGGPIWRIELATPEWAQSPARH